MVDAMMDFLTLVLIGTLGYLIWNALQREKQPPAPSTQRKLYVHG